MVFGSYFGDWDSQDNFLRAPLASGALTSAWADGPTGIFTRCRWEKPSVFAPGHRKTIYSAAVLM
jgi:hypothetical protein